MMNKRKASRARKNLQGFTLIEMAMVLVIIGLVMGGVMGALGPQLEQKKVRDTQERIKEASEAIMAFAIAEGRLPCPANDTVIGNGNEQFDAAADAKGVGKCANFNNGFVPARTLGLGERGLNGVMQDGWGSDIRYAVTQIRGVEGGTCGSTCYPFTKKDGIKDAYYVKSAPAEQASSVSEARPAVQARPGVPPVAADLLQVCKSSTGITTTTCGADDANRVAWPAFIVWSTARNGAASSDDTRLDEKANLNDDRVYVSHSRTEIGATNGAFDDLLQWRTFEAVFWDMTKMGILP